MDTHGSVSARRTGRVTRNVYATILLPTMLPTEQRSTRFCWPLAECHAAYKLIRSLVQAEKLDSTPYEELVKIVKNHYYPKSSVMQRYKFNTRTRTAGESIAVYVAVLRDLAQHCEFKETLSDSYETGLSAE